MDLIFTATLEILSTAILFGLDVIDRKKTGRPQLATYLIPATKREGDRK